MPKLARPVLTKLGLTVQATGTSDRASSEAEPEVVAVLGVAPVEPDAIVAALVAARGSSSRLRSRKPEPRGSIRLTDR